MKCEAKCESRHLEGPRSGAEPPQRVFFTGKTSHILVSTAPNFTTSQQILWKRIGGLSFSWTNCLICCKTRWKSMNFVNFSWKSIFSFENVIQRSCSLKNRPALFKHQTPQYNKSFRFSCYDFVVGGIRNQCAGTCLKEKAFKSRVKNYRF